jgi:CheY-like chemotaxis protein
MGGELQLISPISNTPQNGAGKGSRFFFSIEVPVSEHRAAAVSQLRKVTGYCLSRSDEPRRELVVDDKLSNWAVLRDTLEPLGFVVQEATDGIEVPSACQRFRPDIILMDLRMPKVDGFAAVALLKEHEEFRHIPVIAVTASIAEGEAFRQRCLQHGFADYIHKPFSAGELVEIMAAHLHVELAYSEPVAEAAAQEAIILPPQALLDELAWLAEIGEIQGITEKGAEIAGLEAGKYRAFARQVQELAEDFQFEALQNLISPAKKEQTCTL